MHVPPGGGHEEEQGRTGGPGNTSWSHRGAGGGDGGQGSLGASVETAAPATPLRIQWQKMDGWMFILGWKNKY